MSLYEEFLSRLLKGEKILIDGGTGTEVERRGVPQLKNAWNAGGALTHPEIIKGIHSDFIKEGAKIIISNTFATCKHLMKDADCLDDFELINKRSVELAVEARNDLKKSRAIASPFVILSGLGVIASSSISSVIFSIERNQRKEENY